MLLQLAFHIIILMIWSICPLASAADPIIAQLGCNSTCGNVRIPYPFGMTDPTCYADEWFEIECRNISQGQTPYLKSINLEVTSINESLGTVYIMNPIYSWNCKSEDVEPVQDIRGSPFVYSQKNNKFMAVGCNKIAFLQSNGSDVGGCVSICDDKEDVNKISNCASDCCNGKHCCETFMPSYLSEYNATIENLNDNYNRHECSYALIISDYFFSRSEDNFGRFIGDLKEMDYAPAALEWEILNRMLTNSTLKLPSDANCYDTNVTSSQHRNSGRRCKCKVGFNGNPYVAGGCLHVGMIPSPLQPSVWIMFA